MNTFCIIYTKCIIWGTKTYILYELYRMYTYTICIKHTYCIHTFCILYTKCMFYTKCIYKMYIVYKMYVSYNMYTTKCMFYTKCIRIHNVYYIQNVCFSCRKHTFCILNTKCIHIIHINIKAFSLHNKDWKCQQALCYHYKLHYDGKKSTLATEHWIPSKWCYASRMCKFLVSSSS